MVANATRLNAEVPNLSFQVNARTDLQDFADASFDMVNTRIVLQHLPSQAVVEGYVREFLRVLRPDGLLYVQEPLAEGRYYEATRLVEDERDVRRAAADALERAPGFDAVRRTHFLAPVRFADFEAFRERHVLANTDRAATFEAHDAELRAAFERLAERDRDGWRFLQPTRVDLLRRGQAA
jgi:SAM-dependent methyltransferase